MNEMISFTKLDGTKFDIDPDCVHVIDEVKTEKRDKPHTVLSYGYSGAKKEEWRGIVALDHPFDEVRVCLKGPDAARSYAKGMGADVDKLNPKSKSDPNRKTKGKGE